TAGRAGKTRFRGGETMKSEELKALQTPPKGRYRGEPGGARGTPRGAGGGGAEGLARPEGAGGGGRGGAGRPAPGRGAGAAARAEGTAAGSGDMLLEALVACAGVTLRAVATALGVPVRGGRVRAEGDLDFRGTLGVSKEAPVGFSAVRLAFDLDTDATPDQ